VNDIMPTLSKAGVYAVQHRSVTIDASHCFCL